MPIPIQHLIQDQPPLIVAAPNDELRDAVGLMIEHKFSQLPVVENGRPDGLPMGIVTSRSIIRALRVFGSRLDELRVRDAVIPASKLSTEDDVFARMDDLLSEFAVLVVRPDGSLAGIITDYDTTHYFRRRAEDMLLVEDIETTLRDHIRDVYGGEESDADGPLQAAVSLLGTPTDSIRSACRRSFRRFCAIRKLDVSQEELEEVVERPFATRSGDRKFEDLSLYDYIELACRPEAWTKLEPVFGVSKEMFREMLDGVRITRNKLMHFRADVGAVERDHLRFCAQWFKHHPAVDPDEVETPAPVSPEEAGQLREEPSYSADEAQGGPAGYPATELPESKFAPLARFLEAQPRSLDRLALGFDEIERIIGDELPPAAREHRAWWSNDTTADLQSAQWLDVNWRVVSINMTNQRVVFARARDRERAYIGFFSQAQNQLRDIPDFPLTAANPLGQNWLPLVFYPGTGVSLVASFARGRRVRLEAYIDTGDRQRNDEMFSQLQSYADRLENALGVALEWEPLPNRRACRLAIYTAGSITDDAADLDRLVDWLVERAPRFHHGLEQALGAMAGEAGAGVDG